MLTCQWLNHLNSFPLACASQQSTNANYISIAHFQSSSQLLCLLVWRQFTKRQLHDVNNQKEAIHIIKLILLLNFNIKVNLFSHTFWLLLKRNIFIIIIWAVFFLLFQLFLFILIASSSHFTLFINNLIFVVVFVCVRSRFLWFWLLVFLVYSPI